MGLRSQVALTAALTITVFSGLTYSACKKDKCEKVKCQHDAPCSDGVCDCPMGFKGRLCEQVIICPTGYEGNDCNILTRDKFVGTWIGNSTCSHGGNTDTLHIAVNDQDTAKDHVVIYNVAGRADTVIASVSSTATMAFNSFTIDSNTTITGNLALITSTVLKFDFVVYGDSSTTCTGQYTKH